jgi:hypothetical protein
MAKGSGGGKGNQSGAGSKGVSAGKSGAAKGSRGYGPPGGWPSGKVGVKSGGNRAPGVPKAS